MTEAKFFRWGIELRGHDFDVLDWLETLNRPFEPFVERREVQGDRVVLFSSQFESEVNADAVRGMADGIVSSLNGAMTLMRGGDLLSISGVIDFSTAPPSRHNFGVLIAGTARVRMSSTGTLTVRDASGNVVPPPPPTPSAPQRWISETGAVQDAVADLLSYAGRCSDWFEMYKLIEAAGVAAGCANQLVAICGPDLKLARATANYYRHHNTYRPPSLMPFDEARAHALHAARTALDRIAPSA